MHIVQLLPFLSKTYKIEFLDNNQIQLSNLQTNINDIIDVEASFVNEQQIMILFPTLYINFNDYNFCNMKLIVNSNLEFNQESHTVIGMSKPSSSIDLLKLSIIDIHQYEFISSLLCEKFGKWITFQSIIDECLKLNQDVDSVFLHDIIKNVQDLQDCSSIQNPFLKQIYLISIETENIFQKIILTILLMKMNQHVTYNESSDISLNFHNNSQNDCKLYIDCTTKSLKKVIDELEDISKQALDQKILSRSQQMIFK
jgi:hypothetical protein